MTDMQGRVVLITGATNGLGEVSAHELAGMGATTVIVGRDETKARRVVDAIRRAKGNQDVHYLVADLSIMDEVRQLADAFKARFDRLDVLMNNAGMLFTSKQMTPDGYEKTFALNHLSYFLLTALLLDMLKTTGTPDRKARIVNVSSDAHTMTGMKFDNLNAEKGYNPMTAYGLSKLENILFTYELARRLGAEGADVTANCLHPGLVDTGFGKNNNGFIGALSKVLVSLMKPFQLSAEKGAETQIYLASSPEVEGVSGQYFNKKKPKRSSAATYDQAAQERLWAISEELTGLKESVAD
ncbi:MAG: SDR family oxidoreductase [Chloroflexota bacterium]